MQSVSLVLLEFSFQLEYSIIDNAQEEETFLVDIVTFSEPNLDHQGNQLLPLPW